MVERLRPLAASGRGAADDGRGDRAAELRDHRPAAWRLAGPARRRRPADRRRIVHATADFSFARSLRIHPEAVERGRAALAAGKPVICDVRMLQAGMTKVRNEVLCAIDRAGGGRRWPGSGCTRAAAAMELLAPRLDGAIVAVGNAPTALWKVLEIARGGGPRPALVVGLPVGLVGAREAKLALLESDLCYITNTSRPRRQSRGGRGRQRPGHARQEE